MTDLLQACEFRSIRQQLKKHDLSWNFREESFICKRVDTHIITRSNDVCGSSGKGYFMHFSTVSADPADRASLETQWIYAKTGAQCLQFFLHGSRAFNDVLNIWVRDSDKAQCSRRTLFRRIEGGYRAGVKWQKEAGCGAGCVFFHRGWKRILGAARHHSEHDSQGSRGFWGHPWDRSVCWRFFSGWHQPVFC